MAGMMQPSPAGPSYTVLRIKRKATETPLSSLVIQDEEADETTTGSRKKKRRETAGKARGVFRLAETVPETWQGKGEEEHVLKERIEALLHGQKDVNVDNTHVSSSNGDKAESSPVAPTEAGSSVASRFLASGKQVQTDVHPRSRQSHQYRVISSLSQRENNMLPPRVLTNAELQGAKSALTFVDAEAVAGPSKRRRSSSKQVKPLTPNPEEEREMAAFLPMLEEYLKLEKPAGVSDQHDLNGEAPTPEQVEAWVIDLYYRAPSHFSIPLNLGVGDGIATGALLGYHDDDESSYGSDSEAEDEADEDSNDEDYYRNDYPEDEDADEDMQGYKDAFGNREDYSDEDEGDYSGYDSEGGHGARGGTWDYR